MGEKETIEAGECPCGVVAIDTSTTERNGCIEIDDFYGADSFECLRCPDDLLAHEFYANIGTTFHNVCERIAEFLENEFDLHTIYVGELAYAFLACEKDTIRGACGYEHDESGGMRFKLYLNPLTFLPDQNSLKVFTKLLSIAIHEVSHIVLHRINPDIYHVKNNYHCPEFFEIYALIDEHFYDRNKFMKETMYK